MDWTRTRPEKVVASSSTSCQPFSGGHVAGMGPEARRQEANSGAILCSDPGTFWAGFHRAGGEGGGMCALLVGHLSLSTTTEPGWSAPPSCRNHRRLLKAGISDPLPTPQGDRQQDVQDSSDPVLCVPTSLCSLYKWEHISPPGSLRPRARVTSAGLCQMGHVPGRPARAGLEVCGENSEVRCGRRGPSRIQEPVSRSSLLTN